MPQTGFSELTWRMRLLLDEYPSIPTVRKIPDGCSMVVAAHSFSLETPEKIPQPLLVSGHRTQYHVRASPSTSLHYYQVALPVGILKSLLCDLYRLGGDDERINY